MKRESRGFLTGNIKTALEHVDSNYILIVQHDFPFVQYPNLIEIIQDMDHNPELKHVRFNKRANLKIRSDAVNDLFGKQLISINNTYTRTPSWSDNNHICKTSYYINLVFIEGGKRFPESDLINNIKTLKCHDKYGTYLYGPLEYPKVINHTDGAKTRTRS